MQVCQNVKLGWKHHASLDTPKGNTTPPSHIFRVPLRGQPICRRYSLLLTHPLQVLLSGNSYLVALDSPEQVNSLSGSRPITFVPRSAKLLPRTEPSLYSHLKHFLSFSSVIPYEFLYNPPRLDFVDPHISIIIMLCMSTDFTLVKLSTHLNYNQYYSSIMNYLTLS